MKGCLVLLWLLLEGCATCEQHPIACHAAIGVVVSGAIYGLSTHATYPHRCDNIAPQC